MSGSVVWAFTISNRRREIVGAHTTRRECCKLLVNEYFVVVSPLCYTSVHAANLALVCALKENQMLFWEFLNVCIKVVIGY